MINMLRIGTFISNFLGNFLATVGKKIGFSQSVSHRRSASVKDGKKALRINILLARSIKI